MNSDEYNPAKSERATKMVNNALEEMHRRRSEFRRARRMNSVTRQMQAAFQSAVVDAYDELYPYRHKVKDDWRDWNLDNLHVLDNETVKRSEVSTAGGRMQAETVKEPYRIPCQQLLAWSKCIDDIARDLGFSAPFGMEVADIDEGLV